MTLATVAPERPEHEVAIIGAGLGGIGAAIALDRAGISDYVLLERASDIGGTWRDNTYPGIAVDIPAQAYQFSFELKPDWSRVFARGEEVKAYIDHCADRYDVRGRVRLNSEVLRREWDERAHLWRLRTPAGETTARFVISAVGAFVNPKPAEIAGVEDFEGTVLRSAAWDHSVSLEGRRAASRRDGRERGADHPRDRAGAGAARRLPAHPDLGLPQARLPHRGSREVAVPALSVRAGRGPQDGHPGPRGRAGRRRRSITSPRNASSTAPPGWLATSGTARSAIPTSGGA